MLHRLEASPGLAPPPPYPTPIDGTAIRAKFGGEAIRRGQDPPRMPTA